jgi:hypothetical protein
MSSRSRLPEGKGNNNAQPRMIERVNHWLKAKDVTLLKNGGFNHYRVAQAVLSH